MASSDGYVTVGLLARGGMGEVRLGLRRLGSFRRLVAIKRLRAEHKTDPEFRRMFLNEAKLAGLVRHPNVVSVLDVGEDVDGPFLVMNFIEGVTAHRMIAALAETEDVMPLQIAVRVAQQVALGLAAVHELTSTSGEPLNLIHRDISPQNILIGFDGVARLADFGIAKTEGSRATTTGVLKGKVGYMSPEQLRFERPTQRSDLFSLGVVLYELLAGERLYSGADSIEVAQKILGAPPPDLFAVREDVPPELVELCFELLAKRPEVRPPSARNVARRIGAVLEELVAQEGALPLDEFLRGRFGALSVTIREQTERLVRQWEEGAAEGDALEGSASETPTELDVAARAKRRRPWAALGASLAALALLALGWGLSSWVNEPAPERASSVTLPERVTPVTTPPAEPAALARAAEARPDDPTPEPTVSPAPDGDDAREPPRRRRRRRPARRAVRSDEERDFRALDLIEGGR